MTTGEPGVGGPSQAAALEALRSAVRYRRWLADLADPWLGTCPIEIGSGLGDYAEEWSQPGRTVTVSEADEGRQELLRTRFTGREDIVVRGLQAPITVSGDYSAAVAINVLEHIEDDVGALRSFANLVRPGGHVVVLVPAFQFAMSEFDRAIGHHRRYTVPQLASRLRSAGLEPLDVRYINPLGLIGWLLFVKLLRGEPREGFSLRVLERLVPLLRWVERHVRPPFGQSVFAVAATSPDRAPAG